MEQITKNIFFENKIRGCNPGFVVTSKGVVLIDTPIDLEYIKIWKKTILDYGKVLYIINTEHHMDHFFNNSCFDVDIISHKATRDTIQKINIDFVRERTKVLYNDPFPIPDDHKISVPTITYTNRMTLHIGQYTFQIIHTPGHTAGQSAVYIPEEKVLFTGDSVLGETRMAVHDASLEQWVASLKMLQELEVDYVLPGHGTIVLDKKYLKVQEAIVSKRLAAEKKAKVEGIKITEKTLREIDPCYDNRDTGMKSTVVLGSTLNSISKHKHD